MSISSHDGKDASCTCDACGALITTYYQASKDTTPNGFRDLEMMFGRGNGSDHYCSDCMKKLDARVP